MNRSSFILELALSLGLLVFFTPHAIGQDQANTTTATSPAIVLATTDPTLGAGFHSEYKGEGELPELPLDHHFVFVVNSDGKLKSETRSGDIGYLKVTLYPNAMLKLYHEEIDESWETIRDSAALGLTQLGISAKQAAIIMQAVQTFPEQMQAIDISVSQNPQTRFTGLRFHLRVRPTKGSWFGNLVAKLRPHSQGTPVIKKQNVMLAMSWAVDTSGLQDLVAPLIGVVSQIGARNKQQRTSRESMLNKLFREFDGGLASFGDPWGGSMHSIISLRNPEIAATIMKSGEYRRHTTAMSKYGGLIDVEFETEAFSHREIPVMQTILISDHDISASTPSGEQISYAAVAGKHLISTSNSKPDKIKSLIDASLDQKIVRKPLPDKALAIVDIKLMDLLDKMRVGNPFEGLEDSPEKVHVSLDSKGGSLNLRININ